jgi:hypothetical protein
MANKFRNALDLAQAVDHEGHQLDAAVPRNLVLGLEPSQQEGKKLRDQARCRTIVGVVVVLGVSGGFALFEVCSGPGRSASAPS